MYFSILMYVLCLAVHVISCTPLITLGRYAHCFLLHYGKISILLISLYHIFVWTYTWLCKRGFRGFFCGCSSSVGPAGSLRVTIIWHLWEATDEPPWSKPEASFKISWMCINMPKILHVFRLRVFTFFASPLLSAVWILGYPSIPWWEWKER